MTCSISLKNADALYVNSEYKARFLSNDYSFVKFVTFTFKNYENAVLTTPLQFSCIHILIPAIDLKCGYFALHLSVCLLSFLTFLSFKKAANTVEFAKNEVVANS